MPARRPAPTAPLDPPMVPFALIGTAIWAAVGLVLWSTGAPTRWLQTCLAGALLGCGLLAAMVIRDRRHRRGRRQPPGRGPIRA